MISSGRLVGGSGAIPLAHWSLTLPTFPQLLQIGWRRAAPKAFWSAAGAHQRGWAMKWRRQFVQGNCASGWGEITSVDTKTLAVLHRFLFLDHSDSLGCYKKEKPNPITSNLKASACRTTSALMGQPKSKVLRSLPIAGESFPCWKYKQCEDQPPSTESVKSLTPSSLIIKANSGGTTAG